MPSNVEEVKVPVPYGYLATKVWGSQSPMARSVIALHGWKDNAGTFDTLLPLLQTDAELFIVAIDLPGHGLSSHIPKGMSYTDSLWLTEISRVVDHFKFKEFTIIGHSMGAKIGFFYASCFPKLVKTIISLDAVFPRTYPESKVPSEMGDAVRRFLDIEKNDRAYTGVYQFDQAIDLLMKVHQGIGEVSVTGAKALIKRGTRKTNDGLGYRFNTDNRMNAVLTLKPDIHFSKILYSNLKCKVFIVVGKESILDKSEVKEVSDLFSQHAISFEIAEVQGDHFVHLSYPERVAPHLRKWLGN